jgi:hypothetical protein
MLRQQTRIHGEQALPGVTYVTEDYEMKVTDTLILVSSATADVAITLPPVAEAQGKTYVIRETNGGNTTTVTDNGDAVASTDGTDDFASGVALTAANDRAVLYSDGLYWHPLFVVST